MAALITIFLVWLSSVGGHHNNSIVGEDGSWHHKTIVGEDGSWNHRTGIVGEDGSWGK